MKKMLYLVIVPFVLFLIQHIAFSEELPHGDPDNLKQALAAHGYNDAVVQYNLRISVPEMHGHGQADLWATLIKHAGDEPLPTILVSTAYRRELMITTALTLFPRGYNILAFDLRGTGSSEDLWHSYNIIEHADTAYVIDQWIPKHPWSDGKVGMIGASYMGSMQLLASGHIEVDDNGEPVHLKALFPFVTMADPYKDIAMHGGNLNLEFIPLWILSTDLLALFPSSLWLGGENVGMDGTWEDPDTHVLKEAGKNWMDTLKSLQYNISWFNDPENILDNEFYDQKSPMIYWPIKNENGHNSIGDNRTIPKNLPVFLVGGWYDIFTRGTLNNYQYGLSAHDVEDKAMMIGPWYHLDGSVGLGVSGLMPTTNAIPARWFDWKIKGIEDPFMVDFPVLLYVMGEKKWRAEKSWPLPESRLEEKTFYLSKQKASHDWRDWFSHFNRKNNYRLVEETCTRDLKGDHPILHHNPKMTHGILSRSTARWMAGGISLLTQASRYLLNYNIDHTAFYEDERLDETGSLTFTSEKLKEDIEMTGPMTLTFYAKTTFDESVPDSWLVKLMKLFFSVTGNEVDEDDNNLDNLTLEKDVQWVVEVNDVYPAGRAKNITSGWLRATHRPWDDANEHEIDSQYTPFDPFYGKPDRTPKAIDDGELYRYIVEIWPTCNVFRKGHRIRVSISSSDFPHLLPVMVESDNTIVIDDTHPAALNFKTVNTDDEGVTWKWIEGEGKFDDVTDYVLSNE